MSYLKVLPDVLDLGPIRYKHGWIFAKLHYNFTIDKYVLDSLEIKGVPVTLNESTFSDVRRIIASEAAFQHWPTTPLPIMYPERDLHERVVLSQYSGMITETRRQLRWLGSAFELSPEFFVRNVVSSRVSKGVTDGA